MFGKRFVTMLVCFAFFALETAQAQDAVLSLRWAELGPAVANKKVRLVLRNDTHIEGTVVDVQSDALSVNILKTSDKKVYPVGQASIARVDVFQVLVKSVKGPMRLIGAAGIGAAGSLISLRVALSESIHNWSDESRIRTWIGVTAASIVGGYILGRRADSHETLITITPE
jgi:hypothetical protein